MIGPIICFISAATIYEENRENVWNFRIFLATAIMHMLQNMETSRQFRKFCIVTVTLLVSWCCEKLETDRDSWVLTLIAGNLITLFECWMY